MSGESLDIFDESVLFILYLLIDLELINTSRSCHTCPLCVVSWLHELELLHVHVEPDFLATEGRVIQVRLSLRKKLQASSVSLRPSSGHYAL